MTYLFKSFKVKHKINTQMNPLIAKPFLKWAGGKTQLIAEIQKAILNEFISQKFTYVVPFIRSGKVLFKNNYQI